MSTVKIRAALEAAVAAMSPALQTAWENVPFTPPAGIAYQQVFVIFAEPSNREFGSRHQELGFMQVKLLYPLQVGTAGIAARAELLRDTFKRGNTFTKDGVTVMVASTPEITPGVPDGDRFAVSVKIPFIANIG